MDYAAIDLPWPPRVLHPNARAHWARKAKATNAARLASGWAAKAAGLGRIDAEALKAVCIFSPPDNRARDLDGMLSNIKAYIDGIADVIGVDDSRWRFEIVRADPCVGGNVRIQISAVGTWEHASEPISRSMSKMPTSRKRAA